MALGGDFCIIKIDSGFLKNGSTPVHKYNIASIVVIWVKTNLARRTSEVEIRERPVLALSSPFGCLIAVWHFCSMGV